MADPSQWRITREVATASQHNAVGRDLQRGGTLDPSDPQSKFNDLADIIVDNLKSPYPPASEEVQDTRLLDTGDTADLTLQGLDAIGIRLIVEHVVEIDPRNNQEGGEPGGNIRVASHQEDTAARGARPGTSDEDTDVVDGAMVRLPTPLVESSPTTPAWAATRVPLAGEFTFGGQKVFVVANHWSSKGGDQSLFGPPEPAAVPGLGGQAGPAGASRQQLRRRDLCQGC